MTFNKWALKDFLTINEAVDYLSEKGEQSRDLANPDRVSGNDVIKFVLDGHLPLVVYCPTGTRQTTPQGWGASGLAHPRIEEGLWDVVLEGERGEPARQHLEHMRNPRVSLNGVQGAWVSRPSGTHKSGYDYRQLEPVSGVSHAAFPGACELGIRPAALDALLEQKAATTKERIKATWQDVTITFTSHKMMQVKVHEEILPACSPEELQEVGFWNRHAKRPSMAWEALVTIAKNDGTFPVKFGDRRTTEKRMQEIRANLRAYIATQEIEIDESKDPLPYKDQSGDGRAYVAVFNIRVGKSF